MTKLVPIAQQASKHQQAAAHLTAQGFRLYSILALHRNDFAARELYCKQAAKYSLLAEDRPLLISSLKGLGDTYYYRGQYVPALHTYQDTLRYVDELSPLLQSKVYTSLAVAYAHVTQRQEAFHYLGMALDAFPDSPESDSSFSYAEFDLSQLILWEGITRSQLGETKRALNIFNRVAQPGIIIPERIRVEIINQQAKTAIVSGDLEQGSAYVESGVTGAKTLGSQRRYNEAYDNYKQMALLWPQEKRVKELRELFV
jgi:tetratricopeptide (TPR) repeat protein